jgi:putative sugar O-methyltransferase
MYMVRLIRLYEKIKLSLPKKYFSKLTAEEIYELNQAKIDIKKSIFPFLPTDVLWKKLSTEVENRLHLDGIYDVEGSYLNQWFSAYLPNNKKYYQYACWLLYKDIQSRDTYHLLEKISSNSNDKSNYAVIKIGNKFISWDYLISINSIISIADYYPEILTDNTSVLDLGSGWGRMGYYLKKLNSKITYIAVDLPAPLIVAQSYLQKILPESKIYNYSQNRNIVFSKQYFEVNPGMYFIGTQDLLRFDYNSVDLVININSFQEMEKKQVEEYFSIIDKVGFRFLYLSQRFEWGQMKREAYPYNVKWNKIFDRELTSMDKYFESMYEISSIK